MAAPRHPATCLFVGVPTTIGGVVYLIVGLCKDGEERALCFNNGWILLVVGIINVLLGYFLWLRPYLAERKFYKEHPELKYLKNRDHRKPF